MSAGRGSYQNLQPLRIPSGWTVVFNNFEDIDPEAVSRSDEDTWLFTFNEDILYIRSEASQKQNKQLEQQTLGIDLGWYPDGDPDGSVTLYAILNNDWVNPLLEFSSRSKDDIVHTLEKWLFVEFMPRHFINEEIFRKNHRVSKS